MDIEFKHCGMIIRAQVIHSRLRPEYYVVFPNDDRDDLGFSIIFFKREGLWYCDNTLARRFPETFKSIIDCLQEF